jgi:hypothetical protein
MRFFGLANKRGARNCISREEHLPIRPTSQQFSIVGISV